MTARRAARATVLSALLSTALAPMPARAAATPDASATVAAPSTGLVRGLSDGRLLANADPELRAAGINVARSVGGRIARIPIGWSTVIANETFTRPDESTIALSDPAHPAYRWSRIDASMRDLAAAGLTPLAYLMAAPPWAQSAPRYDHATPGTWAPRPSDLAAFASAVARRYDGTYPDPTSPGQALPRIREFQTWNEPNLARYLGPQWLAVGGRPQLFSARWYRKMHAAAYAAIHARQPDAVVGLAGLAPTGAAVDGTGRTSPMRFLRSLLCLGDRRDTCGAPLPFDAIALHPLSVGDPDRPARLADDLALADLAPKLHGLLADARAAGRLRSGPAPELWITELNWTSAATTGIAPHDQAAVIGRAMLRLHLAGARMVNWQFATDPPTDRTGGEERPAGLTTNASDDPRRLPGAEKPFAAGYRFPVAAIALGRHRTFVWGLAPAGVSARRITVEVRRRGEWHPAARLAVSTAGIAQGVLEIPRDTSVRLRLGATVSPSVTSTLRLGLTRPGADAASAERAVARRATGDVDTLSDPRPTDPDGPGPVSVFAPLTPGGTPPTAAGRPITPVPAPARPARRLLLVGTPSADVLIGSSGADRLVGAGGNDLLIGMGGDDRFEARTGRVTIVRNRRVERR